MAWKDLIPELKGKPWTYRLKIAGQPLGPDWSKWLIAPAETYIETAHQGPYSIKQIKWIDINPIEIKITGRLMPATKADHSDEIIQLLKECSIPCNKEGGVFRIFLSSTNI